jgi:hypothetical protein
MDYVLKQFLMWGINAIFRGDIWSLQSPYISVWRALFAKSVNIDRILILNMNFHCEHTIVFPWLCCLFNMAKAAPPNFELRNSVTCDTVNLYNFGLCAFAHQCFTTEPFSYFDECWRTWWQTMHLMPGMLASSIPQCKLKHHYGACAELFKAIGHFEPTFIEANHASNIICIVRSPKSWIIICLFCKVIETCIHKELKDIQSDMAQGIWMLHNSSSESFTIYDTVYGKLIVQYWLESNKQEQYITGKPLHALL